MAPTAKGAVGAAKAKAEDVARAPIPKTRGKAARAAETVAHTRLAPEQRERMIVDGAVRFFSETGFSGQTRELSRRLAITQPLLYRYFPSKKALIDRVYREVFLGRWDGGWEAALADRSLPLRERLLAFYRGYMEVIYKPEWIRLYMYSGLAGIDFNRRYIARIERLILKRIALELRHEFAPHGHSSGVLRPEALEMVWQLHGGIFYYGVRRFIYRTGTHVDPEGMLAGSVDIFLAAGRQMFGGAPPARRKAAKA